MVNGFHLPPQGPSPRDTDAACTSESAGAESAYGRAPRWRQWRRGKGWWTPKNRMDTKNMFAKPLLSNALNLLNITELFGSIYVISGKNHPILNWKFQNWLINSLHIVAQALIYYLRSGLVKTQRSTWRSTDVDIVTCHLIHDLRP